MKSQQQRDNSKRARKLNTQEKKANTRAKYGPRMKPAPVIVKNLSTGEVVATTKRAPSPDEIRRRQTKSGGWTRATLLRWGVFWPPPRGWRKRLEDQWRAENPEA